MSGTRAGGLKTAITNRERHGDDFYREIGRKGGKNGHTGGFAANRQLAVEAGRKGGLKSRRGKGKTQTSEPKREMHKVEVKKPWWRFWR